MSVGNFLQQSMCLVQWANSELDSDEIWDLHQLLEGDGLRFVKLVGSTIQRKYDQATNYRLENLDDAISLLTDLDLVDDQTKDFFVSDEHGFASLLWKILVHFIIVPEFDDTRSLADKYSSSVDMKAISASAVKWAFSFAGPFVPRVLDQMIPNLSIVHDGKLLLAMISQGLSFPPFIESRAQR